VTDGNLLKGVRFFGDGTRTQSIVMTHTPARVRFIDTVHLENKPDVKVRSGKEEEDRRQKTEGRRQKTEDRRQKAEDRRQKTEDRRQNA
jgi:hypothetical protein